MKGTLVLLGSVIAGNYLAERFLLKSSPEDSTGMFLVADGFGMDDVARAAAIVGVSLLAKKFLGG